MPATLFDEFFDLLSVLGCHHMRLNMACQLTRARCSAQCLYRDDIALIFRRLCRLLSRFLDRCMQLNMAGGASAGEVCAARIAAMR